MAVQSAKTKTRGEGPVAFSFVDHEGEEHKRVPASVVSIVVKDRISGKTKEYNPSSFSSKMLIALAAFSFAKRAGQMVNANKNGKDVHYLADKVFADFAEGRLYGKSEGGAKRGRPFNAQPIVDAVARFNADQVKAKVINKNTGKPVVAMTDANKANLKTKIESMPTKQRTVFIAGYKSNSVLNRYILEAQAKTHATNKEDLAQTFDF